MIKPKTYHSSEDAEIYRRNASFVFSQKNAQEVLNLLDVQDGETILDLGCGSGELTDTIYQMVSRGGGRVIGVDASKDMIEKAKAEQKERYGEEENGLRFIVGDGQNLERVSQDLNMVGKFDKVFSNAAIHWMSSSPSSVISGIHQALKPNGTLAIEMGGQCNMIGVRSALHSSISRSGLDPKKLDPWFFPSVTEFSRLLTEKSLFQVSHISLNPRLTPLNGSEGLERWLETFAGSFLNAVEDEAVRKKVVNEVVQQCHIDMQAENGNWNVMYVRLRCKAQKLGDGQMATRS